MDVICLHGWFGSATGWGPGFVEALDTERFRYHFLDYRGYGARRGSGGPYTLDEIAEDTLALADEADVGEFALIGHSMGGSAIQRVLATAPDRVRALVGVNPVPASGVPFDQQSRQLFESAAGSRESRAAIIDLTTGNRLSGRWVQQMVDLSLEQSDEEAFGEYLLAWADTDHSGDVPGDSVPTLALAGENDLAMSPEVVAGTWGQLHPSGQVLTIANAGHYPMFETPVHLATVIEEFLGTVRS